MSEPTLYFLYNHGITDGAYNPSFGHEGEPYGDWKIITPITDLVVYTGGGIEGVLPTPTCVSGTRDATIRPSEESYIIPQVFIEHGNMMYHVPLAGYGPDPQGPRRYVFCVYVDGTVNSDIYLEAWDDFTFSTTVSEVLIGSSNSSNKSYINAIRTTSTEPPWHPGWSGSDGKYLRGSNREGDERLRLKNASSVEDEAVYFNIYIRLETDSPTFHVKNIMGFRYLYA